MKKAYFYAILAVLIAVFAFSAYKLGAYWMEKAESDKVLDNASQFVDVTPPKDDDQSGEQQGEDKPEQIEVDFEALHALNDDVVAWIYCPDTKINYPVLQASNNDYYLYRLLDGTVNDNGSIFMDYRNDSTFKDGNTMIYGHHMQSGAMFADLMKYEKQSYYDQHPYLYILTPERNYRLDLFAAAVVQSTSDIYDTVVDDAVFQDCIKRSTFKSDIEFPTHNVVTLSTCTYDYHSDDRYVVLGELVPTD